MIDTKNCLLSVTLLSVAPLLGGCGLGTSTDPTRVVPVPSVPQISGSLHGGQQPITGANVQLYAAGTTGLQSAATALLHTPVTTDSNGMFTITNDWSCPSAGSNSLLYLVGTQGNPGLGSGVNSAIAIMAALGDCNSLGPNTFININELTTVAAAYSLAPFMADYAHVGALGVGPTGLKNAFLTANTLVSSATGYSPGTGVPANVTVPSTELNTIANSLATCVNSGNPTVSGSPCQTLFGATTPSGGSRPTDTIAAALSIAKNPAGIGDIVTNNGGIAAPFQPTFSTANAPSDWTVALKFTGGGLSYPAAIAIDASGNAWVANAGGSSVTGISSTGTLLTGASGYAGSGNLYGAQGIAVDRSGNLWVADTLQNALVKITVSSSVPQASTAFTAGGVSGPIGIAVDSGNNVWASNFTGGSVTELNSSGAAVGASPLTASSSLKKPLGLGIDNNGNVWVTDAGSTSITEFSNAQAVLSGSGYSDGAILEPAAIALDGNGRTIIANSGTTSISLIGSTGSSLSGSPGIGGGVALPSGVAVDGQGIAWVANGKTVGSISSVVPSTGVFTPSSTGLGQLNSPVAIAVDASGSLWTANAGDNSVTEFIGLATPVTTPLAMNVGP